MSEHASVANVGQISPSISGQHPTDPDKVAGCLQALQAAATWPWAPVLAVEDVGNGAVLLDGHHRCAAARAAGIQHVPAYIITVADYCQLLNAEFHGCAPDRLCDLDDYICLPDGRTYADADLRTTDD